MERAEYSKWLERARKSTDVKYISRAFIEGGEIFREIDLERECIALNKLFNMLKERGLEHDEIEECLLEYGGKIHEIYVGMGIKAGARLEMELLCEK